jgi:hypothetical protein
LRSTALAHWARHIFVAAIHPDKAVPNQAHVWHAGTVLILRSVQIRGLQLRTRTEGR